MAKYTNPYAVSEGFVDLGPVAMNSFGLLTHYDLYALIQDQTHVSFGARYGNEGHEYLSGTATLNDDAEWDLYGGFEIYIAMARFFSKYAYAGTLKTHKKVS